MQESNPLMDKRTLLAIFLIGAFFFAWEKFMAAKYPQQPKKVVTTEATKPAVPTSNPVLSETAANTETQNIAIEKTIPFENSDVRFLLSSHGMGFKEITIKKYLDKENNYIKIGDSSEFNVFSLYLTEPRTPVVFDITEKAPGHFLGISKIGKMEIIREIKYIADRKYFENQIKILNPSAEALKGISILMPDKLHAPASSSFLFPSYEQQDFYLSHSGKTEDIIINHKDDIKKDFNNVKIISLNSQYFSSALLDKSELAPSVGAVASMAKKTLLADVSYVPASSLSEITLTQILYAGPKSLDILDRVDPEISQIINFGMLGFISRPLLLIMKAFFELVSNWGVAIILLTLLVRMAVLPLHVMAMKSMKAMQKIQPLMQSVRERYKDDPMTMNREIMALMKEHKASPVGGCLPMLLQIPIFFALYQVIRSSVELYQSPFAGWITDLSSHDRFYVLPVLMGITMFVQQKMTPTNMDPTQAKILAFMPLIFTVFMLQLPSGLTLYMFVSALFGLIQQWIILKEKKPAGNS